MEHPARHLFRPAEPAYLRNLQGWSFFLEACETAPGRWRGAVRIQTEDAKLTVRIRGKDDRGTEAEALQDAKDCAESNFRQIGERRRHEASAGDTSDRSCDERRKAEMLFMACLWPDQEMRTPAVRTMRAVAFARAPDAAQEARLHPQPRGLREKSQALIDELRLPRDRQEPPARPGVRFGEICRIGKNGKAAP